MKSQEIRVLLPSELESFEYFTKNFISFESKCLYKATVILIYYFIAI